MTARVKVVCSICKQSVALTIEGRLWRHGKPGGCPHSGRLYTGQSWRFELGGRRIALTPGPDTYQPTQGAA